MIANLRPMSRIRIVLCAIAGFTLLSGCKPSDLADANVLQQVRIYFPLAEVSHPRPDLLTVNTHVNNVSEMFAAKVMSQLILEHQSDLQMLPFLGYQGFQVQFADGLCGWTVGGEFFRCRSFADAPNQPSRAYAFNGTPAEIVQ